MATFAEMQRWASEGNAATKGSTSFSAPIKICKDFFDEPLFGPGGSELGKRPSTLAERTTTLFHEVVHQIQPKDQVLDVYRYQRGFSSLAQRKPEQVLLNPDSLAHYATVTLGRTTGTAPQHFAARTEYVGFSQTEEQNLDIAIGALDERMRVLDGALSSAQAKAEAQLTGYGGDPENPPPELVVPSSANDFTTLETGVLTAVQWSMPTLVLRSVDFAGLESANHQLLSVVNPLHDLANALVGGAPLQRGWVGTKIRTLQELLQALSSTALLMPRLQIRRFLESTRFQTIKRGEVPAEVDMRAPVQGISDDAASAIGAVQYPEIDQQRASLPGPLGAVGELLSRDPGEIRAAADARLVQLLALELLNQTQIEDAELWAWSIAKMPVG